MAPNLLPDLKVFTQPQPIGISDLVSLMKLQNEQADDAKARAMPTVPGAPGSGTTETPSESSFPKIVGGASAGAVGASSDVMNGVHSAWSNQGMSGNGIAGVMANIQDESGFNPKAFTPNDQHNPKFRGTEAQHGHGLYQEGGDEWNNYSAWLKQNHPGANPQDGAMQSQFAAWRLRTGYPAVWKGMNEAKTPGEAAAIYVNGYLKPAARYAQSRTAKYKRGVPGLDQWMTQARASQSHAQAVQTPVPGFAQGGIVTEPTLAMIGENGPEMVVPLSGLYNKEQGAGPKVWTQTAEKKPTTESRKIFDDYNRQDEETEKTQPPGLSESGKILRSYNEPAEAQYAGPEGGPMAGRPEEPSSTGKKVLNWVRENPGHAALAAQLATIAPPLLGGALYYGARPLSYIARNPWQAAGYAAAGSEIAHILAGGTESTTAKHVISTIEDLMHAAGH